MYIHPFINVLTMFKNIVILSFSFLFPQKEKIQRTEAKRCTVNHVAEFEKRNSDSQRTEVQRYPILM